MDDILQGITPIGAIAPRHRAVPLENFPLEGGGQAVALCQPVNGFEMLKIEGVLPGADPSVLPPDPDDPAAIAAASAALQAKPTLIDERLYPVVIMGAFFVGADGKPLRPTFSLDDEPGKVCIRGVHVDDVMRMYTAIKELSGWSGGPAEEAAFPVDGGGSSDRG